MHFKLLSITRMKRKINHLYLKMALTFSGDISLNTGPVTRYQINDRKFEAFSSKGLYFIHVSINFSLK